MYSVNNNPVFEKMLENTQLYQVIGIDGDTLTYRSYSATGKLFDGFQLKKSDEGNELVEMGQGG